MTREPLVRWNLTAGRLDVAATGSWTADQAGRIEELVKDIPGPGPAGLIIDVAGVQQLDVFGAWLLERLIRGAEAHGRDARLVGVPERFRGLLERVHEVNRRSARQRSRIGLLLPRIAWLGRSVLDLAADAMALVAMIGALVEALARVLTRPRTLRLASFVHHLDRVGLQAVPIVALITFLIGCIIAQQGLFHFREFGAEDYAVDLVGILILREIGVLIVAIMVAGRSGSSYTAELGAMKMREEIDALTVMGRDPVEVLMLPRVIALVCALPMLTFLGSMAALYGGGLVAWGYGGLTPPVYLARLNQAVTVTDFEVGMIKAPFMALVIGAIACSEGQKVRGSTESLGLQTTASVVKSIFMVIVLDGLFAIFFSSIGM